jgi:hypothetical protein
MRAQPSHPFHNGRKVDASARRDANAEIADVADIRIGLGGSEQGL